MRFVEPALRGREMGSFRTDVRLGVRMLRKSPGFAIASVAALALGIGADTAIFSVVNTVLLTPLTYPGADRMVDFLAHTAVLANNLRSIPEFHFFQRQTNLFKEVAAYDNAGPGFNLTGGRPEQVHGIHVTESYFGVYGTPMALGRTFTQREDSPHGGKVVVLSYSLWQRRFGGDQAIVGNSLSLGNEPYNIVGVIGKDFVAAPQADLWLPSQFDPVSRDMNILFEVTGLLQPGADRARIRKMVVWHGMRLTLVGVVAGIAASFGLTRLLSAFLSAVKPRGSSRVRFSATHSHCHCAARRVAACRPCLKG